MPLPASLKLRPTTGMNCQEYEPTSSVSLSTPHVTLFRASLLAMGVGASPARPVPPVPATNSRMPKFGSSTALGLCGANRSYTCSWPFTTTSAPYRYRVSHSV